MSNFVMVVYTQPNCQWCDKAKELIRDFGWDVSELNIREDVEARQFMKDNNHKTVPQIYLNGEYIGDYTGLVKWFEYKGVDER